MLPKREGLSPTEIEITPAMFAAGVEAFGRWDAEHDDPAMLVAGIFYSMKDADDRSI